MEALIQDETCFVLVNHIFFLLTKTEQAISGTSIEGNSVTGAEPATTTWKYLALASSGTAEIPGTGSCMSLCVSCNEGPTSATHQQGGGGA